MPDTPIHRFEAPFRQIQLDFHTHGAIEKVGAEFDPEAFAATLERACVSSVTCFARCHYGWLYYKSQQFPERIHPHLVRKNLLLEQIEACHKRNIRVPVYTSVLRDAYTVEAHPEWRVVGSESSMEMYPDGVDPATSLCINTPYRDFLKAHTRELLETLPLDGLFFDMDFVPDCFCAACRAGMETEGTDPSERSVRREYAHRVRKAFIEEMTRFAHDLRPEIRLIFPCAETELPYCDPSARTSTEVGVQSIVFPAGDILAPLTARRLRSAGEDAIGQTSRFHREWNDIHSYKNRAALDYACFQLLCLGCKVLIGDHLSPSGRLDAEAYKLIGGVYSQIELKEPWCWGAKAITDIGVLNPVEFCVSAETTHGVLEMLEVSGQQFDILDSWRDFTPYKVLLLPDCIIIDDALREKLDAYLLQGGSLLASYASGMKAGKIQFALKALGVEYREANSLTEEAKPATNRYADYILTRGPIGKGLPDTAHIMYSPGFPVSATEGSEILAEILLDPYNASDKSSLSTGQDCSVGIVKHDRCIYFAHQIFWLYAMFAPLCIKRLFLNALEMLLPVPLLHHDGPTSLRATVMEQAEENRWIVHLLHYIPQRRDFEQDVLEEVIPLYETKISIRVPKEVQRVTLCPQHHDTLDFWPEGDTIEFVVPRLYGHQMIAIEFG